MKDKIKELGYSNVEIDELLKVSSNIEEDYKKLLKDYPIQYLIGYVNFYGYKINVNENVLIPRYETEYLVEKTIKYAKKKFNNKIDILDIGTGSGCISIALYKNFDSNVVATDISDKAIEVAKNNSTDNNCKIDFIKTNLNDGIDKKFDVIISNPPYISKNEVIMDRVRLFEPNNALYADNNGLYFYEEILKNIKKNLKKNFIIAFEIGENQGNDVKALAYKYLDNIIVNVEKDLSNRDRYIFITSE